MMEEEQMNPLAVTHLLQHTLRSLCIQDDSQWVYAVFWRILPRNYPPPKWDLQGGIYDRTRGNRRNWILVWEDGFCNFAASSSCEQAVSAAEPASSSASYPDCNQTGQCLMKGLQPDLFFKMSHEIYNYGEGLIGKVAADHSHKWVFKEPHDQQEINFLSSWNNPADSQPRTWEAQFQSGIKTIALVAVREGVVQLGATNKVMEDLSYVAFLRKKFAYLESIPGVLLPHPSTSLQMTDNWAPPHMEGASLVGPAVGTYDQFLMQQQHEAMRITPPSMMTSLETLLSKLPAVVMPSEPSSSVGYYEMPMLGHSSAVAKEEDVEFGSSSMPSNYGQDQF